MPEVVAGEGASLRVDDGELEATQPRRPDLVLHPDHFHQLNILQMIQMFKKQVRNPRTSFKWDSCALCGQINE